MAKPNKYGMKPMGKKAMEPNKWSNEFRIKKKTIVGATYHVVEQKVKTMGRTTWTSPRKSFGAFKGLPKTRAEAKTLLKRHQAAVGGGGAKSKGGGGGQ